ncbi:MAG: branched-chain amino acid transaminase [Chloroflexi bacterium]|nr:branched-chain amino acid transaminase [Chloroflexota bacterium]
MGGYAYFRKRIVPLEEAKVSIVTHAFNYGTGCFEGIRGNWNADHQQTYLFRMRDHFERLKRSARVLRIEIAESVEDLCEITSELVRRSGYQEDVYVRPIAYKSGEVIGVRLHDIEDDLNIFVAPFGAYLDADKGIRCCTSSWRRVPDSSIPSRAKVTGVYVNSALAKSEAWDRGCDEAVILSQDGNVSEGSGENIFIVSGGELVTPPPAEDILIGITRGTVMELARTELGIETIERAIPRSELYTAEECFMTGTAAHLTPVVEIDNRLIADGVTGPITSKLAGLYNAIIRGRNSTYRHWCTAVAPAAAVSA